jgi:hypothetical protein
VIFILSKTEKEMNTTKRRKENNTGQNNNFVVKVVNDTIHTVPRTSSGVTGSLKQLRYLKLRFLFLKL